MASSTSSSSNSSTSTPTFLETPENAIIDQISGVASGLANQMLSWAQSTFAQTSAITNQAVGNFFQVSQNMLGLSGNLTSQYNNLFAPENAQLVADANSYASPGRMAVDMGQAGATQAQAGNAALQNSEEALRSYGIDPSSGRYAALDKASQVQNAANVAGAENTQRNADIATGQRLRSEAVQVGAQLPAAIANVNNTAIQANTGASNATLANANTGANLMKLPNDYLGTAMGVKLPISGQNSQSVGSSQGMSTSPDKSGGGGGSGSGGGGGNPGVGGGGGGPAWMPQHGGMPALGGGVGRGLPGAGIMNVPPYGQPGPGIQQPEPGIDPLTGLETGTGNIGDPTTGAFPDYGSNTDTGAGAFGNTYGQDFGNGNTADPNIFGGQNTGGYNGDFNPGGNTDGGGADTSGLGAYSYNPSANPMGDTSDLQGGPWQDPAPQMSSDPGIWGDPQGVGTSSGGGWTPPPDPMQDPSSYDQSSGSGSSADGGGDTSYSHGGAIPMKGSNRHAWMGPKNNFMAAGGVIPQGMSPSGGQQTDDIAAQGPGGAKLHMNANEFVIPQDVALWKGQEFFQKLIEQSRKSRVTAPAQPTHGQPAPQQMMR